MHHQHTLPSPHPVTPGVSPTVSIIIVNYNTREMTRACLDSVLEQTQNLDFELILVDNASADGSAAALADHPAVTKMLALDKNIGFARANNLAAHQAQGRYLLLLNPDTVVLDRAIERLVSFAGCCPKARIWGGRTTFADGGLNPSSCWGRMTVWNQFCRASGLTGVFSRSEIFNGEAFGGWQRDTARHVDIVSGCFFMIERALWTRLEGFDPKFFMYGEEADLCLRARHFGALPIVTPSAEIIHYGGASERTRVGKMIKLLAAKASLIDRHFRPGTRTVGNLLLRAWPLSRWLALALLHRATGTSKYGEAAGIWHEIWVQRHAWQNGYAAPPKNSHETPVPVGTNALTSMPN